MTSFAGWFLLPDGATTHSMSWRRAGQTYMVRTPSGIRNATRYLPNAPYSSGGQDMVVTCKPSDCSGMDNVTIMPSCFFHS